MNTALEVDNLAVCYRTADGRDVPAVRGVSFTIRPGEAVGLLGESGCGKTSIALSLLRLHPAAGSRVNGRILFKGVDLGRMSEREMEQIRGKEISLIFQEPSVALNPVLRIGDQIGEVIRAHRRLERRRWREEVRKLLEQVQLSGTDGLEDAFPHELSGGQRQRVLIAQALACDPALVVADEPTTGLDTRIQAEILALLRGLKSRARTSFLFISHHPAVLAGLVDRVMVMCAGRIVEEGCPAEIYANPLHPYTEGLLHSMPNYPNTGGSPPRTRLRAIPGSPADPTECSTGCGFSLRCPERFDRCDSREPIKIAFGSRSVNCCKYES